MTEKKAKAPTPRALFERKVNHQFGLTGGLLRAISELHYPDKL
ncbi:hypothetical protein [Tropicimonas sp. S265A]